MNEERKNNILMGKKLIKTAIKIDESLAEILRVEVKRLKKLATGNNNTIEEIQKTNNLVKNIILAFMITDEKIKAGIDLCMNNTEDRHL